MDLLDRRLGWALASVLVLGCGDDGSAEDGTSSPGTSAGTGATSAATGEGSSAGHDEGSSGGSATTNTTNTTMTETTGGVELCNGWMDDGPSSPWLELYGAGHVLLESGGTYSIECGGQGSWMFPIYPEMGGWELQGTTLYFAVEVVVEGFPGSTGGSFYQEPTYYYDLECFGGDEFDGGFAHDCIAVLPPDGIPDLAALDGAPATIHVELGTQGGDPIVIDLVDMTLSAPAEVVMQECFF
ncbi:MAG: hypothetical protein H6712_22185 [Myxococcales bacterium]|nr:hypothetical protein [Myxococcales bacterium]MCB9716584.1 hypothetical protein [Myxococcales bacterium]